MVIKKHTVGIFSRDGEDNYIWLINLLQALMFHKVVENVIPVYISNNLLAFQSDLFKCTFAILYHTKNRGRLNITNVTDSLYDQELEDLSHRLGRDNVIVLLDDLEDISENNKRSILQEQPLIYTCTCALILISDSEKESAKLKSSSDPRWSQTPSSPKLQDDSNSINNKISDLLHIISKAPKNNSGEKVKLIPASDRGTTTVHPPNPLVSSNPLKWTLEHSEEEVEKLIAEFNHGTTTEEEVMIMPASDWDTTKDVKECDGQFIKFWKKAGAWVLWITGGLIVILIIVLIFVISLTV